MSGAGDGGGGAPWRHGPHRVRTLAVASGASLLAAGLAGQGLLVPAGTGSTVVRVAGALVALAALAVLVRLDGPVLASRTLAVVAVAGALTALATLPSSPVTVGAPTTVDDLAGGQQPDDGDDTIVLDQIGPGEATDATLELPPGVEPRVQDGQVVVDRPDGTATVLAPGQRVVRPDGTVVVVGVGALLAVPDPVAPAPAPQEDHLARGVERVLALLLGCFALLAFAPPLVRAAERGIGVATAEPVTPPPLARTDRSSVEEGLADVLRAMLADPDPRTAVIGAYARLLVALDEVGFGRRAEEGPHEHLWRSLGPLGVRRGPVHRLADLFVRARFTPQPITDQHRRAAIAALADAVADLRLPAEDVGALAGAQVER